jgi:hypothetical protein
MASMGSGIMVECCRTIGRAGFSAFSSGRVCSSLVLLMRPSPTRATMDRPVGRLSVGPSDSLLVRGPSMRYYRLRLTC